MNRVDTAVSVLDTLLHEVLLTSLGSPPPLVSDLLEKSFSTLTSHLLITLDNAPGVFVVAMFYELFLKVIPAGRLDVEEHSEHVEGALDAQVFECFLEDRRGALLLFVLGISALGSRNFGNHL